MIHWPANTISSDIRCHLLKRSGCHLLKRSGKAGNRGISGFFGGKRGLMLELRRRGDGIFPDRFRTAGGPKAAELRKRSGEYLFGSESMNDWSYTILVVNLLPLDRGASGSTFTRGARGVNGLYTR